MAAIEIYTREWCAKAKMLLTSKGLDYQAIDVTSGVLREQGMIRRSTRRTVPQIFIEGQSIGGCDDLALLNASGELDRILGIGAAIESNKVHDVAVIGAGPAGMVAAIYQHARTCLQS